MKIALRTGITGQDGAYLAELLPGMGYEGHGLKRRASLFIADRIDHRCRDPHEEGVCLRLHRGDLTDATNVLRVIQMVRPDEIYNLAARSHFALSIETPEYAANTDAPGTLRVLEATRILGLDDSTRFYQASSAEIHGKVRQIPQNEPTPICPRSPYAAAKACAHWMTVNDREACGLFACNGILFNHESPIRGETFVTRKITRGLARIHEGKVLVRIDPRYSHPTDVETLIGDCSKAVSRLGCQPAASFDSLVSERVEASSSRPSSVPLGSPAAKTSCCAPGPSWTCAAELRSRISSRTDARSTSFWPQPGSGASARTAPTPPTSSATTCRSRRESSIPHGAPVYGSCASWGRVASARSLRPSSCTKTRYWPGAGADERVVCHCQDRGHQGVPGMSPSVWFRRNLPVADGSPWSWRQLRTA